MKLNILCLGDVVGKPGRRVLADELGGIVRDREIDCVIVNAENSAGGSGLTPQIYDKLQKYGVNLITLGDHAFRKKEIIPILNNSGDIVRPANLSELAAGRGTAVYKTAKGPVVGILCLIGRTFMKPADCPYAAADRQLVKLRQQADVIFVEIHAEATSDKVSMGYHLDGKVSCVYGTHTHVATADEKIHKEGTAYITDLGMTGPHDSVLGRGVENVLKSFRTQMPYPFDIASGDVQMNGIIVRVDSNTKRAEHIERISVPLEFPGSDPESTYDRDDGRAQPAGGF